MLQEVKDLQNIAVTKLVNIIKEKSNQTVYTFKAPTGSGKTYMMADFMNRIISENENIIFIVSALSKSKLAEQNFESFRKYSENGTFRKLNPYLINSDSNGEASLFIPTDYNVYILPVDLYKEGSKLKTEGTFIHFLQDITPSLFNNNNGKTIYLIKDEGHRATNNLDEYWKETNTPYFSKIINFSATPDLKKKQTPDVEITNEEAENAKLIKQIEQGSEEDTIDFALNKFLEIREQYDEELKVHPCMIIQISNKGKAEEELEKLIIPALDKHPSLKWVYISTDDSSKNEKSCKTNDSGLQKLVVSRWNDYMKDNNSTIDIIIFKMVITEGWDIPRACMLYQIRDSKSKVLDEQVMGRVRRNPRLLDFETLSVKAQDLALTAWIWGLLPEKLDRSRPVKLINNENIEHSLKITPTKLKDISASKSFDVNSIIANLKDNSISPKSIFEKYRNLLHQNNEVQSLCYSYSVDFDKWRVFTDNLSKIKSSFDEYCCNYEKSMIACEPVSFPVNSCYTETDNKLTMDDWIWCRNDSETDFSFDSLAERKWAEILKSICERSVSKINIEEFGEITEKFLWGKNFPLNSEIKFEYYLDGIHASYPDFVMKDIKGQLHIFEVKSINESACMNINETEYIEKVNALKACYKECSNKTKHIFYIPVMEGTGNDAWKIWRYEGGKETIVTKKDFLESLKNITYEVRKNSNYDGIEAAELTPKYGQPL